MKLIDSYSISCLYDTEHPINAKAYLNMECNCWMDEKGYRKHMQVLEKYILHVSLKRDEKTKIMQMKYEVYEED